MATDTAAVLAAIEAIRAQGVGGMTTASQQAALCDVAAAAAGLVAWQADQDLAPWWAYIASADVPHWRWGCYGCQSVGVNPADVDHMPDCPALALDRALAALAAHAPGDAPRPGMAEYAAGRDDWGEGGA